MKPALTVGLLTPYSGVYPHYSAHLITGWLLGMGLDPARQQTVQFIPEYTHQGGEKAVEEAARKLLFFNQVNVLSGLVSYKTVPGMIPLIENSGKPAFFFDMGEYVPYFSYLSPDVFYASHQLWQSQYALGQWAQRTFGDGGHMVAPVYEAGYHLNSAFQQGMTAAGGSRLAFSVLPFEPHDPLKLDLGELFTKWKADPPAYVHAIFCGSMGTQFLRQWADSGLNGHIPLLVQETMAYDDMLDDVQGANLTFYAAQTWLREDENQANRLFVKAFEQAAKQPANVFALMGYEAGLAWREVLPHARKGHWDVVKSQLRAGTIEGPRGERTFYPLSGNARPNVSVVKTATGNNRKKIIVDQQKGVSFDASELEVIHRETVTGWQNPFLCI